MTPSLDLAALPYARFLGLTWRMDDERVRVTLPFAETLIGNPFIPALHGGATAALLEFAAIAQVAARFPRPTLPRPISLTVAYHRPGRSQDTHATARITRAGRRVAYVQAEAFQSAADAPIATLSAHFLLGHPSQSDILPVT